MMKTAAFAAASAADAHSSSSTAHSPSSSAAATTHSSSSSAATATQFSTNKRSDQTHIETRRQKRCSQKSNNDISESDNLFVAGQDASVGTIIKKGAIDMHSKLLLKQALTARQRKIMTNGLSSIADLSDNSLASQRNLFTESEWSELQLLFDERLKIVSIDLNERVKDVIIIVGGTLGLSGDYDCCMSLVKKEVKKSSCDLTIAALTILKALLKIMKKYPHMLIKLPSKKVTESDYLCGIHPL